ncbi:hypothetical protein ACOSQ3_027571 [Xanthoceras sorbifolium]
MLGVAAIPSLALSFGIMKIPESPQWLVWQGRIGEARKTLQLVSNSEEEPEKRFWDIKKAVEYDVNCVAYIAKPLSNSNRGQGVWKELLLRPKPAVCWILITAISIHFFEHAVEIEAVVLYGPRIFKKAALTTLGFSLTMVENAEKELLWALTLSIVAMYTFLAFFSIGIAPITWVYSSKIFPLKLRTQGMAIRVAVNRKMNAIISMTFISVYKAITIGGAFFMFAGIAVIAWWFFYFLLPDTKEKSLEETKSLFTRGGGGAPTRNNGGV